MTHRSLRTTLPRVGALALVAAALAGACSDKSSPLPRDGVAPSSSASAASAPAAPQPKRPPRSLQGSALALSPDGARIFVADEEHEALFLLPAGLTEEPARVIAAPGPPAQIVALDGLVLVTVRSLPTDEARAAREEIRGKAPAPEGARTYAASTAKAAPLAMSQWSGKFIHPKDREKFLSGELAPPEPQPSAKPSATTSAKPGAPPPKPKPAPAPAGAAPKAGTPAKPFNPSVVRKSQGGLLVGYRTDPEKGLVEAFRVPVAPDAWGLGVTPDGKRAVVTSAWAAEVSVIDIEAAKVVATLPVAREPRGIAIAGDGKTAFVSHLVGTALTKITGLDAAPAVASVALPPSPPRTPFGSELGASLAYSLVFSPDGKSLYVPRHAIGAEGIGSWWGAPVVDILDTKMEKHIAPKHSPAYPGTQPSGEIFGEPPSWMPSKGQAPAPRPELVQPRAAVYRKKTDTLLIASEGWDALTEVDALTVDPAMFVRRTYDLAEAYDAFGHFPFRGGAPSAVALSEDEDTAYVYCRSTFDVARVDLDTGKTSWLHLADDGLPTDAAYGRRLFSNARSQDISGGLACAACHPEGRDDGYVWREGALGIFDKDAPRFIGLRANRKGEKDGISTDVAAVLKKSLHPLFPRQTPMLAGRVRASGPYGWHAENKTIIERLLAGFELHRGAWESGADSTAGQHIAKIDYLIDYLQSGLLPPPTIARELSETEKKGKAVFEDKNKANCASCHVAESEFTDRTAYPLRALPTRQGFDEEENLAFKTPSLRFIAGTAPYFHDGSAATLEDLVKSNGNRMGNTSGLSADDQAALVAYMKTL